METWEREKHRSRGENGAKVSKAQSDDSRFQLFVYTKYWFLQMKVWILRSCQ